MKQLLKQSLSLLLLLSASVALGDTTDSFDDESFDSSIDESAGTATFDSTGTDTEDDEGRGHHKCRGGHHGCRTSLFLPRPQFLNSARFFNPFWYGRDAEYPCFNIDVGFRFRQSRHEERIAECLFGRNRITFAGSQVPGRKQFDFEGDQIGLSPTYRGTVVFRPKIRDYMFDFDLRWDIGSMLDWCEGAYFGLRGTAVQSRWRLNPCIESKETSSTQVFANFDNCVMSAGRAAATTSIETALSGDFLFGNMQERWEFGRFNFRDRDRQRDTKLANIDIILGYDFLLCEDYHFGAFFKAVAPTGTKPDAREVFQNIIGNGHHWEVGGGIDAHYDIWDCDDQTLGLYLNGCITHLFKDTQWRSFDIKPPVHGHGISCLSRYSLLKEFDAAGRFTGQLINAINFATRKVRSSFGVQGDAALRLLYKSCGWALGVGYNVYGRSHEKLTEVCRENCFDRNRGRHFGIKGNTPYCCADQLDSTTASNYRPIGGTGTPADDRTRLVHCRDLNISGSSAERVLRERSDTTTTTTSSTTDTASTGTTGATGTGTGTDTTGIIDNDRENRVDIDRRGIPSQLTHKIFATIDYEMQDCGECRPYIGVGGGYEWSQKGSCRVCTPSFWEVWVRTGVNY